MINNFKNNQNKITEISIYEGEMKNLYYLIEISIFLSFYDFSYIKKRKIILLIKKIKFNIINLKKIKKIYHSNYYYPFHSFPKIPILH